MESPRASRTGLTAAIIGAVLVLAILAIILDLGPFADDEPTAAEFLAQGDEICAEAHDDFLDIQGSTPRTAADAEAQVEALIEVAEDERDRISDLNPPEEIADEVAEYVDGRASGVKILEEGLAAAREDNPEAYEQAQAELASQQAKRQAEAQDLGFKECSKPLVSEEELERQAQPPETS